MLDHTATTWLRRLLTWLELFEDASVVRANAGHCVGSHRGAERQSAQVDGSDVARLSDPGTYQAFQHFITHAPWDAEAVWQRLREVVPEPAAC